MCIICNMPDAPPDIGGDFLNRFSEAQVAMKKAAEAMLTCSKVAVTPEARKRYDMTHKQMVRQIREWNKLEESREH